MAFSVSSGACVKVYNQGKYFLFLVFRKKQLFIMRNSIDINAIIGLVERQEPDRMDVILALKNAKNGWWESGSQIRNIGYRLFEGQKDRWY
jgi:hypothetical protein